MAISLTQQYLPESVLVGDAFQELLEPFLDWGKSLVAATENLLQNLASGFKNLMQRLGSWRESDANPGVGLAGWLDNVLKISKWEIKGVNIGRWAQQDPFGFGAGVAVFLTGGTLAVMGKGLLGLAWGGLKAIGSMIKNGVSNLLTKVGLGGLVRWFVGGVQRMWQFNWNQTDQQIRAEQRSRLSALAGRWGEALGASVGTLCGFTLGRVAKSNAPRLVRFNPRLLADLKELEFRSWDQPGIWEEAVDELTSAINESLNATASIILMETYLQSRKFIKAVARSANLQAAFPQIAKHIEAWGSPGSKPWSFAIAQEKAIEGIGNQTLRNFTEEFVEAAQDMCAESTVLVSYALG